MRICIGGDISIKEDCWELFNKGDEKALFSNVIDVLKDGDRVVVNLECAITEDDTPIEKIGPNLKAPLNTARVLKSIGVTDCVLSNNHIFDYGKRGVISTLNELKKYGISYTGFGENELDSRKNHILTDGKIKVVLIAVCEHEYSYALENRMGARPYDPYDTNEDIEEAKKNADYVIVTYHGGKEDCRYPSPRLLKACRSMVKHGADLVLCQHSHAIGCYEKYLNGHILYGQGNFHFVAKKFENRADGGYMWNTGLLAVIDISDKLDVTFLPTVVDGCSIRLTNEKETEKIMGELSARNEELNSGAWREKWREFAFSQPRYKIVPPELYEEIAHFIDCEAHADVCREIYKTLNHKNELD